MRTRWQTTLAHRIVSITRPDRLRNHAPLDRVELVGPPHRGALGVDAATGRVLVREPELVLPGPMPLVFHRSYSSGFSHRRSPLGSGWSHPFEVACWPEPDRTVVRTPDGREVEIDRFDRRATNDKHVVLPWRDASLVHRSEGAGYLWVTSDRLHYELDASDAGRGTLAAITRPEGLRIEVVTDGGVVTRAIAPGGRELRFTYDGDGRLSAVSLADAHGRHNQRVARYEYDRAGDLVAAIDAAGAATRYEYQAHLLVRRTDRSGRSTYFGYDGAEVDARCVRTWCDGGAHDHALEAKPAEGVTTVSDGLDRRTRYRFDPTGLLLERGLERFTYDDEARLIQRVDRRGGVTRFEHDERGVRTTIEPDGARWTIDRDERGNPVRAVDPRGGEWSFGWDSADRLFEQRDPRGHVRRWRYEDRLLRAIESSSGTNVELEYDEHLAVCRVRLPGGRVREIVRDWRSRPVRIHEPDGSVSELRYDALDRVSEEHGRGRSLRLERDPEGRLTRVEGSASGAWEYDAAGALVALEDDRQRLELVLDPNGRIEALRGSSFGLWRFVRDRLGRITEEFDPLGRRTVYRYGDASALPSVVFLASGEQLDFTYDVCGRIVAIAHSDDTKEIFTYAPGGDLSEATRSTLVADGRQLVERKNCVRFTRDAFGEVLREEQDEHVVETVRDAHGLLRAIESSLGDRITIEWDDADRWSSLACTDHGARQASWRCDLERDPSGRPSQLKLSSGIAVRWERDELGRIAARRVERDGQPIDDVSYARSHSGEIEAIEGTTIGRQSLGHSKRAEPGSFVTALPSADPSRFTRDASGALRSRPSGGGEASYRYYASGSLRAAIGADGIECTFEYDALGRIRALRYADEHRVWVWHGARLLHEISSSDVSTRTWISTPDHGAPIAGLMDGRELTQLALPTEPTLCVCAEDGALKFSGWIDARGALQTTDAKQAWPWRPSGAYHDSASDLTWQPSEPGWWPELHDRRRRPLSPDPRGVWALFALDGSAEGPREQPVSALAAWRVSEDAEERFKRSLCPYDLPDPLRSAREPAAFARPDLDWLGAPLALGAVLLEAHHIGASPAPWLKRL